MMTAVYGVLLALVALAVLMLFGAVVELHRQLFQIRQHVGLLDQARVLQFNTAIQRGELPGSELLSDGAERSAVLFFSDGCSTCFEIAPALAGRLVLQLQVVLMARSPESGQAWIDEVGLASEPNLLIDDGSIMDRVGLNATPSVLLFDREFPRSATTVPSVRQLSAVLDWLAGRKTNRIPSSVGGDG